MVKRIQLILNFREQQLFREKPGKYIIKTLQQFSLTGTKEEKKPKFRI